MARRRIGQEALRLTVGSAGRRSSLDALAGLIDWMTIDLQLKDVARQ